jgi:hypothetical protein
VFDSRIYQRLLDRLITCLMLVVLILYIVLMLFSVGGLCCAAYHLLFDPKPEGRRSFMPEQKIVTLSKLREEADSLATQNGEYCDLPICVRVGGELREVESLENAYGKLVLVVSQPEVESVSVQNKE